jgi:hypothetical protein
MRKRQWGDREAIAVYGVSGLLRATGKTLGEALERMASQDSLRPEFAYWEAWWIPDRVEVPETIAGCASARCVGAERVAMSGWEIERQIPKWRNGDAR